MRGDVLGGATAAVVAPPLALAFGIASGAGAKAGLYASIFGGLTAAVFGVAAGLIVNELFVHSPQVVGEIDFSMPKLTLDIMPFHQIGHLFMPALTICLLGSISALLSAEVTDGMIGERHDSNRELIGQGLGNLVSSMIGGIPVSGAVARSGINVHSGGRTRLSSILHSIFLMLMVLVLMPIVKRIPLASLAAILMVASVRTADWKSLKRIPGARRNYGVIMMITAILTVMKDLTIAVVAGIVLASIVVLSELALFPYSKVVVKESTKSPKKCF